MRKLFIVTALFFQCQIGLSQSDVLIGTWSLYQHFVLDTNQNKETNIYKGQIKRQITFHKTGEVIMTYNNGNKINGTWKISKKGRKFTLKLDTNGYKYSSVLKTNHDFSDGKLQISMDRLNSLYDSESDSLNGGRSIYIKTSDTSSIGIDTLKAHQFYLDGIQKIESGRDDEISSAINSFKKANALRPYYYWKAYHWLATFNFTNSTEALNDINIAIDLKPKEPELYALRSQIKLYLNDNQGALNDINWALIFAPESPNYYLQRAQLLKNKFQLYEEAKFDCNRAITIDQMNARPYYERGLLNLKLGLSDDACEDFNKAISLGYTGWSMEMQNCGIEPSR